METETMAQEAKQHEDLDAIKQSFTDFKECLLSQRRKVTSIDERIDQHILRATPTIVVHGRTGMIVRATEAVEELFGYMRGALEGEHFRKLIPERLHEAHVVHEHKYMNNPHERWMGLANQQLYAAHKDGHEMPVDIWLTPELILGEMYVSATILPTRDVPV